MAISDKRLGVCARLLIEETSRLVQAYNMAHRRVNGPVGDDGVIGDCAILPIIHGLRQLLNGETGSMDCSAMDAMLVKLALECGFEEKDL